MSNLTIADLVFIIGLPGSGKTTLAMSEYSNYIFIDDPKSKPKLEKGNRYVITDCHLCKPEVFNQVSDLYHKANYVFFTNNPDQCIINLRQRNDNRLIIEEYIYKLSSVYQPELYASQVNYSKIKEVYNG